MSTLLSTGHVSGYVHISLPRGWLRAHLYATWVATCTSIYVYLLFMYVCIYVCYLFVNSSILIFLPQVLNFSELLNLNYLCMYLCMLP